MAYIRQKWACGCHLANALSNPPNLNLVPELSSLFSVGRGANRVVPAQREAVVGVIPVISANMTIVPILPPRLTI
jgi:hypothetical protein